ncbi:MAG: efflux RND transporter periplasmic adaptor subunit [Anaerolineales bacterium]|nr:efflux RND transporter periplasmic adaptor subunit [Anaerolineales bacterium]
MNHKLPRPAIAAIAIVVLLAVYFGYNALTNGKSTSLTASGSIEATIVNVAPEMAGKVGDVLAEEGGHIETGDTLFSLDDTLLQEQRKVSAANLESARASSDTSQTALEIAQAQYQVALQAALAQDKHSRLGDWYSEDQAQFDQPNWYFTRVEQEQAAQALVDKASKALADAKAKLADVEHSSDKADFLAVEQRLLNARLVYLVTKDVHTRTQNAVTADAPVTAYNLRNCAKDRGYHYDSPEVMNQKYGCIGDEHLTKTSQTLYDDAKEELSSAQQAYNDLLTTQAANDVIQARADVSVAQEQYYATLDQLRKLQAGDQSPSVTAAQRVVDEAQAAYDQSQKAVAQMQANLDLLDAQLAKLIVDAPMDGVILSRNIEPGEYVVPGATAFTMADLSNLTITVYVPENRYGEVNLGQQAEVTVDSFPGVTFTAEVVHIADSAEYTPRNVQTVEGRSSTMFAIKLKVSDPEGKLKPGMPADVVFGK